MRLDGNALLDKWLLDAHGPLQEWAVALTLGGSVVSERRTFWVLRHANGSGWWAYPNKVYWDSLGTLRADGYLLVSPSGEAIADVPLGGEYYVMGDERQVVKRNHRWLPASRRIARKAGVFTMEFTPGPVMYSKKPLGVSLLDILGGDRAA